MPEFGAVKLVAVCPPLESAPPNGEPAEAPGLVESDKLPNRPPPELGDGAVKLPKSPVPKSLCY